MTECENEQQEVTSDTILHLINSLISVTELQGSCKTRHFRSCEQKMEKENSRVT